MIQPSASEHPIGHGRGRFAVDGDPFINDYCDDTGSHLNPNMTDFARSKFPPEAPKPGTVAISLERSNGGRGIGIVMPHFPKN